MAVKEQPLDLTELLQHGYRYALSLTHEQMAAEDLLQDAWVAVLQAQGPRNKQYLFSAIRSRFVNRCKRNNLVVIVPLSEEDGCEALETWVQEEEFPVVGDDCKLEEMLSLLRPVERESLYLSVVEGYTAQEIAQLTLQPRGTVLSLLSRTRQKLRRIYGKWVLEKICETR